MSDNIEIIPNPRYKDYAKLNNNEILSLFKNSKTINEKETIKMALISSSQNLKMISSIIKKNNFDKSYYDDLVNVAREGLIHALDNYDEGKEASFDTYLYLNARYYMLDFVNNYSDFKMSHGVKSKIRRLKSLIDDNKDKEDEIISNFSLSENISVEKVKEYLALVKYGNILSLNNELSDIDNIKSSIKTPEEMMIDKINGINLYKIIEKILNQREKEMLYYRYGLKGYNKLKLEDIAKRYNISIHRVSVIVKNAERKLNESNLKEIYMKKGV